jgi:peptidoglycan-associated lipoprotein
MNATSRKVLFFVVSAAVLLTGCSKKPKRPDPAATVIGQEGTLNPSDSFGLGANSALTDPNNSFAGPNNIIDEGDKIRGLLEPVYFAYDQSALQAGERAKLDAAKAYLEAHPEQRLLIEGRADWRGTADYNLGLGDRRAASAKQYLITLGVADTKIEVLSKGDLEATENASEDVMSKDRRADLVVLKK